MTRMLRLLIVLLATAAFALTGCGGDDDDDGGGDAVDTSDEAAASGDDDDDVDVGDLDDIEGLSEDCVEAFAAFSDIAAGAGALGGGEELDLAESLEQFQAFAEAAPEEISDEMQLLGEAYARFVEVMVESGFDPESGEVPDEDTMAALTEAMEPLSSPEVTEAGEVVSEYFATRCGGE